MSSLLSDHPQPGTLRVKNVTGPESVRLLEMGVTPGATIQILRTAPLGFPIEIRIRGYLLTLRKSEAECVEIE